MNNNQNKKLRNIVFAALLTALAVVLKAFLDIKINPAGVYIKSINFSVTVIMYSGILLGPTYGGLCGGLTDFLSFILQGSGAYNPVFSLSSAATGIIPGLFYKKFDLQKKSFWQALACVACTQLLCSVVINTAVLYFMGVQNWASILTRVVSTLIFVPVHAVLVVLLLRATPSDLIRSLKKV